MGTWEAREQKLVENLRDKLDIFTENATSPTDPNVTESWQRICSLEAEELKGETCGVDLLNAIGFVYTFKAKQFLASNQSYLGVGRWLYNVQGRYHILSNLCIVGIASLCPGFSPTLYRVSAIRAAVEHKAVFEQIRQGEESGTLSAEEKKCLEDQAAEKGLHSLFKGAQLEVGVVLQHTCDTVLHDPTISSDTAVWRAAALQVRGEVFMAVRDEREE